MNEFLKHYISKDVLDRIHKGISERIVKVILQGNLGSISVVILREIFKWTFAEYPKGIPVR